MTLAKTVITYNYTRQPKQVRVFAFARYRVVLMNATEIHKMKPSMARSETIVIVLQWARRKQHAEDKAAICGFLNSTNESQQVISASNVNTLPKPQCLHCIWTSMTSESVI